MERTYRYENNLVLRTVYLPRELDDLLRKLAFEQHKSKNELIRSILQEALTKSAQSDVAAIAVHASTRSA